MRSCCDAVRTSTPHAAVICIPRHVWRYHCCSDGRGSGSTSSERRDASRECRRKVLFLLCLVFWFFVGFFFFLLYLRLGLLIGGFSLYVIALPLLSNLLRLIGSRHNACALLTAVSRAPLCGVVGCGQTGIVRSVRFSSVSFVGKSSK